MSLYTRVSVEPHSSIVCKQTTHFATLLPFLESRGHVAEYSTPQWGQKKVPPSGRRRRTLPAGRAAAPPRSVNNSRRFIGDPQTNAGYGCRGFCLEFFCSLPTSIAFRGPSCR